MRGIYEIVSLTTTLEDVSWIKRTSQIVDAVCIHVCQ